MELSSVWSLGVGFGGLILLFCLHCKRQMVAQVLVRCRVAATVWRTSQMVWVVNTTQTWEQVFPRLHRYVKK